MYTNTNIRKPNRKQISPLFSFHGTPCTLMIVENKRGIEINLLNPFTKSVILTANTLVPNLPIPPDYVVVKSNNETAGLLDFLIANHIIGRPITSVQLGFNQGYVCRLLIERV